MLLEVVKAIWLLIPAYTPNNFAVLFGGKGKPLDFGKYFIDGRRILGDGKTIRGFLAGLVGGVLCANIQYVIEGLIGLEFYHSLSYYEFLILTFLLAFGSMLGDSVGSFIKRRFGFERGEMFPVVDQLMFLVVAILIASNYKPFWSVFDIQIIAIGILITPILHISTNYIAYKLKLKEVPW